LRAAESLKKLIFKFKYFKLCLFNFNLIKERLKSV
jgi:hypothetical protein